MSETPDEAARLRAIAELQQVERLEVDWSPKLGFTGEMRTWNDAEAEGYVKADDYDKALSLVARQAQEIEQLQADRDAFHMDYRIKSDQQSKAALIRAEQAEAEVARQAQEIQDLRTERETLDLKLAACSVAALGNTPAAVAQRIAPGHPYYSASYGDVCRTVDREMELRSSRDALREALNRARGYVVERMQLGNPYDGPAKPGFVAYDLQMIDRALAETPTEDQQ